MKAVLYCRVSSAEQVENFSLPTQEAACREYCERQGIGVERVYVERGESARTADRTEFQRMLSYLREHRDRIDYVVVYQLSRFARNQYDHHAIRALLHQLGVGLRSVTEPVDESAHGEFLEGILAAYNRFENRQRADRCKTGMIAAAEAGRWCWRAPYGYSQEDGELSIVPEEAAVVQEAFRRVGRGETADSVRRDLRERIGGEIWRSRSNFYKLLGRSLYAGRIDVPQWGVHVRGRHEAIVDQRTFDEVQARVGGEGAGYNLDNPDFPLRRFVSCAECGQALTAGWSRGRNKRYGYYRCDTKDCEQRNTRKEVLEEAFVELLRSVEPTREFLQLFHDVVIDVLNRRLGELQEAREGHRRRMRALELRRQRLVEAYIYDQAVSRDVYQRQLDKLNQELASARMAVHDTDLEGLDVEGTIGWASNLAASAARQWTSFSHAQRQRFQRFVFPEGLAWSHDHFLNPRTSPIFRDLRADTMQGMAIGRLRRTGLEPVAWLRAAAQLRKDLAA